MEGCLKNTSLESQQKDHSPKRKPKASMKKKPAVKKKATIKRPKVIYITYYSYFALFHHRPQQSVTTDTLTCWLVCVHT